MKLVERKDNKIFIHIKELSTIQYQDHFIILDLKQEVKDGFKEIILVNIK